jgi:hypothetical protein
MDVDACQDAWERFADDIGTRFWECFIDEREAEAKLSWWVNRFGCDGPEADLKLIMACPALFMWPTLIGVFDPNFLRPSENRKWDAAQRERLRMLRALRQTARKLLIVRFICDRELLAKYYDIQLWSERKAGNWANLFGIGLTKCLLLLFDNFGSLPDVDPGYWDKAMLFVLLAHATSRDAVLQDAKPEDMHTRFEQWREWLLNNLYIVKAHPTEPVWVFDVRKSLEGMDPEALEIIRLFIRRDLLEIGRLETPPLPIRPGPVRDWPEEKLVQFPAEPLWVVQRPGNAASKFLIGKIYFRLHGEEWKEPAVEADERVDDAESAGKSSKKGSNDKGGKNSPGKGLGPRTGQEGGAND